MRLCSRPKVRLRSNGLLFSYIVETTKESLSGKRFSLYGMELHHIFSLHFSQIVVHGTPFAETDLYQGILCNRYQGKLLQTISPIVLSLWFILFSVYEAERKVQPIFFVM
jgi:hypothetical protein